MYREDVEGVPKIFPATVTSLNEQSCKEVAAETGMAEGFRSVCTNPRPVGSHFPAGRAAFCEGFGEFRRSFRGIFAGFRGVFASFAELIEGFAAVFDEFRPVFDDLREVARGFGEVRRGFARCFRFRPAGERDLVEQKREISGPDRRKS